MKKLLAIATLAFIVASCNVNYEKTPSGLAYKIIKGNNKTKFKAGDIIKFNVLVKLSPKDTVMYSTYTAMPQYLPFDTSGRKTHDFTEILKYASVGDSLITVAQVDTLVKNNVLQYNQFFKRGDQIMTYVKLLKVFTKEDDVRADQMQEFEKKKKSEVADLENYLKKKSVKAVKTENGVFVDIKSPGNGPAVTDGKKISVEYTGYLVENGKPFDSNVDSTIGRIQPFEFVVGRDQMAPGFVEGLKKLAEGGSGTLYIPSMQAYGPQGSPPVIPPFAALKFDVAVKKVVDAPPAPNPGAPATVPPGH